MKKIILICLVAMIHSCKPQSKNQIIIEKIKNHKMQSKHEYNNLTNSEFEIFDIKRFNKNKEEGETYRYNKSNGDEIVESGGLDSGEYMLEIFPKKSLYTVKKMFYSSADIQSKGPSFKNGCELGIWYEFDDKGKLIKETNLDKPYKIKIEDIIEFLKKNEADFNSYLNVERSYDERTKKGTWELDYRGKYKQTQGILMVTIDDESNEIEQVIKIVGKEGEKEIIFKK